MAKKYYNKVTSKLRYDVPLDEQINLRTMSRDDMLDLFADTKQMEALGKKVNGYMRQALLARIPDGEDFQENADFSITVTESPGRVTMDVGRMREDMGDNFITKYEKQGEGYSTVKLTRK